MAKYLNLSLTLVRVKAYQTIEHLLVLGVVLVLDYNQLLNDIWHDCKYHITKIANLKLVLYLLAVKVMRIEELLL
jgi:hypothetical protein